MKSVSALVLICVFACASAQFGVKGGSSDGSNGPSYGTFFPRFNPTQGSTGPSYVSPSGVRSGPAFPRLTPGSIQEKKDQLQLANVDEVAGSSGSTSNKGGFVQQPTAGQQQENVVTFVQERPTTQGVLVPSSGSVSSLPSVGSQNPTVVQTVSPGQSSFSFVPSFQPVLPTLAGNVAQIGQPGVPVVQPAGVQTFQPAGVQTFQPAGVQTFQPAGVQAFPPAGVQAFQPAGFQAFQPAGVQAFQPARVQTFQPGVQSFPSVFAPVQTKTIQPSNRFLFTNQQPAQFVQFGAVNPSFPNFAQNIVHFTPQPQVANVQTVSSGSLPVSTFQPTTSSAVAPVSGQIFTDNKISSPGFSTVQSQLPSSVISQEKQSAETVQTTEW